MPKLVIDNIEVEVPSGTKVIEAAERLGIMIPRFCYHHALGSAGACRMCAVKFLQGPFKGVQMSCMVDAQDGMVVSTTDPEAVAFRKQVVEWLMINHPHDCPVCDEGGQCLLQDEVVSGGHGIRRYLGRKRTYRDQFLGPFIAHEMNRCIHCYRCVRYYREFAGYRDLGTMQIGNRVYFGRFRDGALESPFSGNLVDLCPTGVYTDKPSRYRVRRWDLQRSPSLCIHCSLGCNTIANAKYREVVRIEGRYSEAVNGHFICDRGRYGFGYGNLPERPRKARVNGAEVPMNEAVHAASDGLSGIVRDFGPGAVAVLGSARNSLETQTMMERVSRMNGWKCPRYFVNPLTEAKVKKAVSRLDKTVSISLRGIESADFILAVGVDPVNEAPMLAPAMRQAFRKEAVIVVADPRPVSLPFDFRHIPLLPGRLESFLDALGKTVSEGAAPAPEPHGEGRLPAGVPESDASLRDCAVSVSAMIGNSRHPVIVCGTEIGDGGTIDAAARLAAVLREKQGRAGLFYVLPGPNAFAAALWNRSGDRTFADLFAEMEQGTIKALLVVEADPMADFADREKREAALNKLDLLVVLDYLPSETAGRADVFIPSTTLFESGSSFINQEGRLQYAEPVHRGGLPLAQVSGGGHPPRVFDSAIPGGEAEPSAWILQGLAEGETLPEGRSLAENPFWGIASRSGALEALQDAPYPSNDVLVVPDSASGGVESGRGKSTDGARRDGVLEIIAAGSIFGSEELSSYSALIRGVEPEAHAIMHPEDASRAGLSGGDTIRITLDGGPVEIRLETSEKAAKGALILPTWDRVVRRALKGFSNMVPTERIQKV